MSPQSTTTTSTKPSRKKRRNKHPRRRRRAPHVRATNLPDTEHEKTCTKSHPMPEDYTFVPKGDPYITRNCKSRSKQADRIVYIVYDNALKKQLGIRIPSHIHLEVLSSASQTASLRASQTRTRDARDHAKARALLRSTFPCIPSTCLERILQHAFLKGSGRVGRISTRTDTQKATLAVEAHIRHEHTEYEVLMEDKKMGREGARKVVWGDVKRKRDEWAGRRGLEEAERAAKCVEEGGEDVKGREVQVEVKEVEVIDLT